MPRVFIDGGSTAYGLWSGPEGGWADRIKPAHMPDKPDQYGNRPLWKVYNLAAPHRNIGEVVLQLPGFIENYRRDDKAVVAVVQVGHPESRYAVGAIEPDMPLGQFTDKLHTLADHTIGEGSGLVLVGTTAVVPEKVRSVGRLGCRYEVAQRIAYDGAIRDVAAEVGASYVHVMNPLLDAERAGDVVMDNDGLHPNALGHTIIYNEVHPVVVREIARLQIVGEP